METFLFSPGEAVGLPLLAFILRAQKCPLRLGLGLESLQAASGIYPISGTSSGMLGNYYHGSANLRKPELFTQEQGCSLSPH